MTTMSIFGRNLLCALGGALLLSGCTDPVAQQSVPCPQIKIVPESSFLTRFTGDSEDLAETSFEARIVRHREVCYYETNNDTGKRRIRTELNIEFSASRGPNNPDSAAKFRYRVGITGPGNQLMGGDQLLDVEIPFSASRVQAVAQDEVFIHVPLKDGENGDFYRIWVGLEVTEKELVYNRRNPQF